METVCCYGESGADGSFHFEIEPPARSRSRHRKICRSSRGARRAVPGGDLRPGADRTSGRSTVPLLPDGVLFGPAGEDPQTLAAGDGLELTLRRADLSPRIGDTLVDAAARLMPPSQVCSLLTVPGEEIIAVYALHPFAAVSSSPIGVRVPSSAGRHAGLLPHHQRDRRTLLGAGAGPHRRRRGRDRRGHRHHRADLAGRLPLDLYDALAAARRA